MELLIDTADAIAWERAAQSGLFVGITTNPLLIQRIGSTCDIRTYQRMHEQATALGFEQIQFQVFGANWLDSAQEILDISGRTLVKIPATEEGFRTIKQLGVPDRTTLTAVYSVRQAAFAEAAGLKYAAPYYARLNESARDSEKLFEGLRMVCKRTRLLTASLRSVAQVEHLMGLGHTCFTLPAALLDDLLQDEMTKQAVIDFRQADG